jgi:hypothetical protein
MEFNKRMSLLSASLFKNWLYITAHIICIITMSIYYGVTWMSSITMIFNGIATIIVAITSGWGVHYVSHHLDALALYRGTYTHKYIKRKYRGLDRTIKRLCKVIDFHDKDHHNTDINKRPINVFTEFIQNIFTISVLFLIVNNLCNLNFNNLIILAYGIIYALMHNVLYANNASITHVQHHTDKFTNYGLDFVDIVMGSKYDDTLEEYNDQVYLVIGVYAVLFGSSVLWELKPSQ